MVAVMERLQRTLYQLSPYLPLGLLRRSVDFGNRAPVASKSFQSTSPREVDP